MNPVVDGYRWYSGASGENSNQVCSTRDLFQARLDTMYRELIARSLDDSEAALLTAVAGEIGNNCFDHNLGQWRDIHGAWFQHGWVINGNSLRGLYFKSGSGTVAFGGLGEAAKSRIAPSGAGTGAFALIVWETV